jgi:hypothetical protein
MMASGAMADSAIMALMIFGVTSGWSPSRMIAPFTWFQIRTLLLLFS